METYKIEIHRRDRKYLPPCQFDGELDSEYQARLDEWEAIGQYLSFWRVMIIDYSEGSTPQHAAIESAHFKTVENGNPQLEGLMSLVGMTLSRRIIRKNELLKV